MGALDGVKVLELGGLGPGPFAGMLLADMGADVVIVDRRDSASVESSLDFLNRNKRSLTLDLKKAGAAEALLQLACAADMLIDPYRPGVCERLGIGPELCLERNPRLVYGRMTGWGQTGPLSRAAGHDLNYIALTGALDSIGTSEMPIPPLNLLGDYGGGSLYLVSGLLAAYVHALKTGEGQVVDVAVCDGTASLMTGVFSYWQEGRWSPGRGSNFLDGSLPYYAVYRCADGKFISIAPIEQKFYTELLERIGLAEADLPSRDDESAGDQLRTRLAAVFETRTRDQWCGILENTDACFAPVLSLDEAPEHPHMAERQVYVRKGRIVQPAPAPRFAATPSELKSDAPRPGEHSYECLEDWGVSSELTDALRASGAISDPRSLSHKDD